MRSGSTEDHEHSDWIYRWTLCGGLGGWAQSLNTVSTCSCSQYTVSSIIVLVGVGLEDHEHQHKS